MLCCRAAVHLKLRDPEAALKDAECAVELDPQYAKAYLRRASAHQALEHFEEAVKDFEKVSHSIDSSETLHSCVYNTDYMATLASQANADSGQLASKRQTCKLQAWFVPVWARVSWA